MKLVIKNLTVQNRNMFSIFDYSIDLIPSYYKTNIIIIYWR